MIKRYVWDWISLILITLIVGCVVWMCISNILVATDPDGLRIVSAVDDGERTVFTLDCGSTLLQFSAKNPMGLTVGNRIPVFEEFQPKINASITATVIFMCVVVVFWILELFMVPTLLRKLLSKKGVKLAGEIVAFKPFLGPFYTPIIEAQGTRYPSRLFLTKKECEQLGLGHDAFVWNGGGKNKWVEFVKQV